MKTIKPTLPHPNLMRPLHRNTMHIPIILLTLLLLTSGNAKGTDRLPNIVYILCDDLGYGDVKCLGGERSKIPTPNIDRLATEAMSFTEAHASAAICSPSRYSILTGRYNWRSKLQWGIWKTEKNAALIDKDRLTVPALLRQHGFETTGIGKWHLGEEYSQDKTTIQSGPTTRGFDYYFATSGFHDDPSRYFIENNHFAKPPYAITEKDPRASILPTLTRKAVEYLGQHAKSAKPFFLYLAFNAPHVPLVPTQEWKGKSGLGDYGDYVMETDWSVGQVMQALDKAGLGDNTLLIFTSDNGCSPEAHPEKLEKLGHYPSELRRGYKYEIWDGGHRIPFMVRWPGKVKAGTRSDQLISLTDLMATCADILGAKLPDNAGEDSFSILPVLLGTATGPVREAAVFTSFDGSLAIRQGQWKLELVSDSGGMGKHKPGYWSKGQLYDMGKEVSERKNEYDEHPEVVARLMELLKKYVENGRSTPGPNEHNDVPVKGWQAWEQGKWSNQND
jgi:arylsulfatase A-like enzyme